MSAWTGESSLRRAPGQNTATQFPDGKIATFAYDRVGRKTTMVDWGGTSTFSFDALGRQSGQTDAAGFVQAYGYDPNGNRTGLNLVGTGLFTYTFDSLNRLATAQKPGNALYTMAYDADSRRTTMMLGNGSIRQYAHDMRSQLTTQVELSASNVPIVTLIDTYDPVGNRMTRSVNGTVATWTYDDLYRLTGQMKPGQVATYTLDGVGNLKVMWEGGAFPKTFTHDAADRLVTMIEGVKLTTYAYTGYGALEVEHTGTARVTNMYSGHNQLIGVESPGALGAVVRSTYTFSGDGLRRTAQNGNVLPTTIVWDGSDYLLLNGPTGNQIVLTLGSEIVNCGDFDLLPDSLGSVIGDTRAGFDPRLLVEYWPYGMRSDGTSARPGFPFLFVGSLGYYNDSADRDYVRARELYKKLGVWMQTDQLWPAESAYAYPSNPVLEVDLTGLKPGPGGPGNNFGPCAIYYCEEHEFPHWSVHWIPTHAFICVRGPNGGCSGGLYQKDGKICGPGTIENEDEQCPKNQNPNTTCRLLFTSCALASRVCECIRKAAQSPPFYIAPINCCYQFPTRMLDCACKGATFGKDKELAKVCLEHMINTMPLIKA